MIKFEAYTMPASSMGEENPLPDIKNVSYIHARCNVTEKVTAEEKEYIGKGMIPTLLPYKIQDSYDRNKKNRDFKAAILENSHIRAVFLPEMGGRLWSIFDKDKNRELLYVNPVFQPGNLGLRNAWFSGGVEFNVGIKGHNPLTCSPLWCSVDKTKDGEILRLYEYERIRGVVYSISAYLPEDSSVLYLKCRIENKSDETKHMYWWSNIAVPETKKTRVIVPTNETFLCFYNENHYVLDKTTIPMHENIDISYPDNISSSRDFFYKIPEKNHKWIATADENGNGLLQCSTQKLKGRKLFVWGQGQGGRNWNEWLSEDNSFYIEIQAGLAHTQLEHIPMKGNETWEWVEAYTAMDAEASALHGDYDVAVKTVEERLNKVIGNPDLLSFPEDKDVLESKIIYRGSAWGALEEKIRGKKISETLCFEDAVDEETKIWEELLKTGTFPVPDVNQEPQSYVSDTFWLKKLEQLSKQSWYSLLHIGVIKYANEDIDGAKKAWEESLEMEASPWVLRNLSMIYKNEIQDIKTARKLILSAYEMKKDCPSIVKELAGQLTTDGGDEIWLEIYETLPNALKELGRLRLYKAVALINLKKFKEASLIINESFVMSDIKEGELSVSQLWFVLYRNIFAEENGLVYDPENKDFCKKADEKYPLPKKLDFRMHD